MQVTDPISIISQEELAKRWQVSTSTIARWRTEGMGPVYLKLRGQVRYRLEDIQIYEAECLRASTSEAIPS